MSKIKSLFKSLFAKVKGVGCNKKGGGEVGQIAIGIILLAAALFVLLLIFPSFREGISGSTGSIKKVIDGVTEQLNDTNINNAFGSSGSKQ